MQLNWRAISGPALTTATALLAFLVDRHVVPVPNPAPLFVCIVALAASVSGIVSGMTSAVIAVASSALLFLNHRAAPGYDMSDLARMLLLDKASMYLEADLRWLEMTEGRLDEIKRQPLPEPESKPRGRPRKANIQ